MKRLFAILILLTLMLGCKSEKEDKKTEKKSDTSMIRKPSEMASLMNKMYEENEKVKKKILKGEDLLDFPEEYLKIHTATLTDPSDRTPEFRAFSELYLNNLKVVFKTSKDSLKYRFNETVNSCIACHQTTCLGPIPRIKKLLIKKNE